jgi:hypothetical protein
MREFASAESDTVVDFIFKISHFMYNDQKKWRYKRIELVAV